MGSDGPVINGKAVRVHYDVLKRLFSFVNLFVVTGGEVGSSVKVLWLVS